MSIFSGFLRKSSEPVSKTGQIHLNNLRVASPCPTEWSKMVGDERVRHCAECNLNVYNLSTMTEQQVQSFLAAKRGQRVCARFYRRADGTVLTQDCPWRLRVMVRRVSRIGTAFLTAMLSTGLAMAKSKAKPEAANCECRQTAQKDSGIQLIVVDQQSALIPNAQVSLEKSAKEKITGLTGQIGEWNLAKVAPGKYTLVIEAQGFQAVKSKIEIHDGMLLNLKIKLQVAAVTTTVKVEAEPAVVMGTLGLIMIEQPIEDPFTDRFAAGAKQLLRL